MAGENLASRGQAWFCTTGLPSDVVIEVDDMSFHLHKFPLMSKSRKLHDLLTGKEQNPRVEEDKEEDEEENDGVEEEELRRIPLHGFPGGSETFEAAAKFCYGVKIELTASTAAPLRCAADFLQMTEEFSEDNLISRADGFLSQSVFSSLPQSVKALKSCESLLPLADDLGLPQRCIDAIVSLACSAEASSLLGWPVGGGSGHPNALWNGIDVGGRPTNGGIRSTSWMDDLTMLNLPLYKRLISAMKARNPSSELIEGSLVSYARRSIPGLSRSNRNLSAVLPSSEREQLELLNTVITNLSPEKRSGFITTRFLFGLMRTANILRAPESLRTALEKKIASQLEQATLDDLLMPTYSYLIETLYDIEAVERILRHYIKETSSTAGVAENREEEMAIRSPAAAGNNDPLLLVGRLVDGYLAEVASDINLSPEKFCDIALALPDHARLYNDGLYRAVDVYLKAHPGMTEAEKEKVSGAMDFRKLTLEACTHAAQNERLPLRAVVQVLFFEQLQLRQAIAGSILAAEEDEEDDAVATVERGRWRVAARENQLLRLGMDSMRNRVHDLERECSSMRRAIQRMDRRAAARRSPARRWGSIGRRLGCKSRTQVFDSQAVAAPSPSPKR